MINDNTRNQFAQMMKAAHSKVSANEKAIKTAINNQAPQPTPPAKEETPKTYDNLKDIETAANSGQVISLLNLSNLVNTPKPPQPIAPPKPQPVRIVNIQITAHEGSGAHEKNYYTWNELQSAFNAIHSEHGNDIGYTKTYLAVLTSDKVSSTTRIDVTPTHGNGDYNPQDESIKQYLQDIGFISDAWQFPEGEPITAPQPEAEPTPELSTYTIEEILTDCKPEEVETEFTAIAPPPQAKQLPPSKIVVYGYKQPQEEANEPKADVRLNHAKNGIEIEFKTKPSEYILEDLKLFGFRWSFRQKIWYAHQTPQRIEFANSLK